eukprot:TRINITY_DN3767_c0_g1_i1.p1 TRINITY_DN3767_c0_g1~~TRINITY_DN3767_c0_g1_i1.p1  ORF type:complete len:746 (+),score=205.45 TRINITY_DN3767_c0_g1_i1:80-2317(+)
MAANAAIAYDEFKTNCIVKGKIRLVPGLNQAIYSEKVCTVFGEAAPSNSMFYALFRAIPRALREDKKEQRAADAGNVRNKAKLHQAKESVLKKLYLMKHALEKRERPVAAIRDDFQPSIENIIAENEVGSHYAQRISDLIAQASGEVERYVETWIAEIEQNEVHDGRYEPYTLLRSDPEALDEIKEICKAIYEVVPGFIASPAIASQQAIDIAVHGEEKYNVLPRDQRLGPEAQRDIRDEYPALIYRNGANTFYEGNCWFPLAKSASADSCTGQHKDELFALAKRCFGQVMCCDPTAAVTPVQACNIMLKMMVAYYELELSGDARINDDKLSIFKRLQASVQIVREQVDANREVRDLWHRQVMSFVVDREGIAQRLGSMQEILEKALVCGIPWSHVCQTFMREFLVRSVRKQPMRKDALAVEYVRHLQRQVMWEIRSFLFMIALNSGNLTEGSLATIRNVSTFREAFLLLGVVPMDEQDFYIDKRVEKMILWAVKIKDHPYREENIKLLEPISDKQLSEYRNNGKLSVAQTPIHNFWKLRERILGNKMGDLVQSHDVNNFVFPKDFLPNVCVFCKEVFRSKEELFRRHLDPIASAIEGRPVSLKNKDERLSGIIASHKSLVGPRFEEAVQKDGQKVWKCSATKCRRTFATEAQLNLHQQEKGVPFDWSQVDKASLGDEKEVENDKIRPEDSFEECAVCLENEVDVMVIPCGHQCFCEKCVMAVQAQGGPCPLCRVPIKDILKISF